MANKEILKPEDASSDKIEMMSVPFFSRVSSDITSEDYTDIKDLVKNLFDAYQQRIFKKVAKENE